MATQTSIFKEFTAVVHVYHKYTSIQMSIILFTSFSSANLTKLKKKLYPQEKEKKRKKKRMHKLVN